MKKSLWIAGMMLASTQVTATELNVPEVCKSVANYAAQTADLYFSNGDMGDKYDPSSLRLRRNLAKYPITQVKTIGNCDEDGSTLNPLWCRGGGGSAEVYQLEIGKIEAGETQSYPVATVTVSFHRGGCVVDLVERK